MKTAIVKVKTVAY